MNVTSKSWPLTRLSFASLNFATLSHKGRGKKPNYFASSFDRFVAAATARVSIG